MGKNIIKVSVLIPFHGVAPYLESSILSVLNQTYPELEIVLVNDRAHESALDVAYSFKNRNVKVVHSELTGVANALNYGLMQSNGSIIARLDADDLMLKERIELQVQHFKDDTVLAGSQIQFMKSETELLGVSKFPINDSDIRKFLRYSNPFAHPSVIFRKEAVLKVGGYRNIFSCSEDYDLWIRIAKLGNMDNLNQALTQYRIHDLQVSNLQSTVQNEETMMLSIFGIEKINELDSLRKILQNPNKWIEDSYPFLSRASRAVYQIRRMRNRKPGGPQVAWRLLHVFVLDPRVFLHFGKQKLQRLLS